MADIESGSPSRSPPSSQDDLYVSIEIRGMHIDCNKFKTDYKTDSGRLCVDKTWVSSLPNLK